ncbi:TPA: hypothetical protein HA281_04690 [Candidatus Woesearchaeota archaeon]|nr:MAG: hypothetical protein QT04_C0018G0015 [archaeon GW2011_AR11]MBS3110470.1 hypothetical protein [Candidatus Woesearchaeota archaeon]HIH04640.1 hypothetical protein [Candidatus Woesearchaeota archaeon]HIH92077.1 hypothetical protein [Candidatus Woesearchaeota archaeon]HII64956.1 hypothetical protein [Candidatus Woesearchaeota archaeon]
MMKLSYEQILATLEQKAGLPKDEIEQRVKNKLTQLSGLISREGAAHIVANELGVKLLEPVSGKLQIKNILAGMRDVETQGKVLAVYDLRSFTTSGREGKVCSFMLGDETGSVRVVAWGAQAELVHTLKPGDVISLLSGYVRDNQGRTELHINERAQVAVNPSGVSVNVAVPSSLSESPRKSIKELSDADASVEVLATVVQLFEPRFFEICTACGRRVKPDNGELKCLEHGTGALGFSYVLNAVLDDGTESIRSVFFREQAASLLGLDDAHILQFRDNPSTFEPKKTELLGTIIKLQGRVTRNAMFDRMEIVAKSVDTNPDPKAELARLESS